MLHWTHSPNQIFALTDDIGQNTSARNVPAKRHPSEPISVHHSTAARRHRPEAVRPIQSASHISALTERYYQKISARRHPARNHLRQPITAIHFKKSTSKSQAVGEVFLDSIAYSRANRTQWHICTAIDTGESCDCDVVNLNVVVVVWVFCLLE